MRYLILLLIAQIWCSCGLTQEEDIHDKIQEDLADGVSRNASTVLPESFDTITLPKKRYRAEPEHSSIQFRTAHWEIVDVIGWFETFEISMYADRDDFTDAVIYAQLDPRTIVMPNQKMMGTLQNPEYLDTKTYPLIYFISRSMVRTAENQYQLIGEIDLKGIKKEMALAVSFNGFAYPGEQSICGFTVKGTINRKDFGFGGDHSLHSGRKIHDDLIHFTANLRME